MQRVHVRLAAAKHRYEIKIGRRVLPKLGDEIRSCLPHRARRVVVISNQKVFSLYGAQTLKSLRAAKYVVFPWLVGDGEQYKTLATVQKVLLTLSEIGLERTDAIVALGGGVIGDVAGFAAKWLKDVAADQTDDGALSRGDCRHEQQTNNAEQKSRNKSLLHTYLRETCGCAEIGSR